MSQDIKTRLRSDAAFLKSSPTAFNKRSAVEAMNAAAAHIEALEREMAERQALEGYVVINATQQNALLAAAEALDDLGAPLNAADIRMIIGAPSAGQTRESVEGKA